VLDFAGAAGRNRTVDLRITNAKKMAFFGVEGDARQGYVRININKLINVDVA
jgi:hypothetical protein